MAKRKNIPQPAEKASYASRTAQRVVDNTSASDEASSNEPEPVSSSTAESSPAPVARKKPTAQPQQLQRRLLTKKSTHKQPPSSSVKHTINKAAQNRKTRVLREIRDLQKSTKLLIPRAPFLRLVNIYLSTCKCICQRLSGHPVNVNFY